LKPVQANSSQDPISKIPSQKRADEVAQGICPEFKPQYRKKKRKENEVYIHNGVSFSHKNKTGLEA
jgi:hypothetical protein